MTRLKKQEILFRGYFTAREMVLSIRAMDLALSVHCGKRKDGCTPEVSHQFEIVSYVLQILADKIQDKILDSVVAACFLHDVVEDYPEKHDCEDILRMFGPTVFEIVCLVTKSSTKGILSKKEALKEYYSEMMRDEYAVIVKAADRIHNIQSMVGVFELWKREKYIEEVEEFIFPLLKAARKKYPSLFLIYINLAQLLEKQIYLIKKINELEKKNR